jgi:DNA-binding transcriptional LysR family regulator
VFDEIRQSAMDIQSIADPTSGEIRMACFEGLSATILPEILLPFVRQYPHVVVHVDNLASGGRDLSGLQNRLYDLAFVRLDAPQLAQVTDEFAVTALFDDDLVVGVGPDNPLVKRASVRLADLVDEPWILSPPGFWHHARTEEAFRAEGLVMPPPRIVSLSVTLRAHLLAAGPYVSVFAGVVMQLLSRRFGMVALPVKLTSRPWPVVIVTLKNRAQRPVVERFIQSAKEVAQTLRWPKG